MGARDKLNSAHITGILVLAGFMGLAFQSWGTFILIAMIGTAIAINNGDLRPQPMRSNSRNIKHTAAPYYRARR